ncbi:glycosyltransferase family 2 protein [Halobacterium litoreum]|uniref:Glycosyltransferase family 2 protein n=1 Tax=Halobacterium litoreum TaxID=2039234 RepID=A0ABD5NAS5_9EURY|nr:glycosyltransferase family 2 protein [Halobacterium litoreum]UHH12133.1 glycosyltransferase family 2 protein [Halobacterium litoreum]
MYRERTVAVVVPAHDEAAFVGSVVAAIPDYVDRVYLVDDCSGDDTRAVALDAADPDRGCRLDGTVDASPLADRVAELDERGRLLAFRHDENRGAGGAVVTGYLAAVAESVDLVATIDADGQMDPTVLARFLDPLADGDADYAKGSRLDSVEDTKPMPAFRLFGNAALTALCRVASGYWGVSDPVNGYTAITGDALEAIDPATVYEGYGYGIDVLGRLRAADRRVVDVPHESAYGDEASGIDYGTYVPRVSELLARTLARRLARERPKSVAAAGVATGVLTIGLLERRWSR